MMTAQSPLAFTFQTIDEWDEDNGLESFYVLNLNGKEIYRDKTSPSSDPWDAVVWAQGLFAGLLARMKVE